MDLGLINHSSISSLLKQLEDIIYDTEVKNG